MSKRNDSPEAIATTFEEHEFAANELATIKKTRRRAPRLGQAKPSQGKARQRYTASEPHPNARTGSNAAQPQTTRPKAK